MTGMAPPPGAREIAGAPEPSPAEIRAELARILESPAFRASPRRRDLLCYLVEEALTGRRSGLKGPVIAVAVFGRDASFDSQSDPVVRLEARRLRRDLDGYYAADGAADPVRIAVPTGAYLPHFDWYPAPPPTSPAGPPPPSPSPSPASSPASSPHSTSSAPPIPSSDRPRPASSPPVSVGPASLAPERPRWRRWWPWGAGAALAAALAAGWLAWHRAPTGGEGGVGHGPAVMVLPFEPLSTAPDDRFIAAGITEEVISGLIRFEGLRLFSVPAGIDPDLPGEAGGTPAVAYAVKGSVRSDDGAVRVSAQLVDATSGQVLWSQTFDRALTPGDLLAVQAEIADDIATTLGQPYGVLGNDLQERLASGAPASMASYACLLRAYDYRRTFRAELNGPVRACLDETIRREPDYAAAWAMLGWLHLDAARFGMVPEAAVPGELDQALAMSSRAVALDPTSVVALQALSAVRFHLGDIEESERLQRQALALNPQNPDTLAQLGWRLAVRGRWDEGIGYLRQAIARTVNPPGWYYDLIALDLYRQGRYRDMLPYARRSSTGDPIGLSLLAIAQGALGDPDAARATLARMADLSPELARDPAAVYRRFQPADGMVDMLLAGLRQAGWTPPETAPPQP